MKLCQFEWLISPPSQVAGLPTNINFLQKLADHWAFESGKVETHFIDNYKDDLFVDPNNSVLAKEAYEAARLSASLAVACLIEKEHVMLTRNHPGKLPHSSFAMYRSEFLEIILVFTSASVFREQQLTPCMVFFSAIQSPSPG